MDGLALGIRDAEMRILIIDDQMQFLDTVAGMLTPEPGIDAIRCALGGREGLEAAAEMHPDVVLTDFSMPDINGLDVIRRLKTDAASPRVAMMSLHTEPEYRESALRAGADAYLVKSELYRELVPTLRRLTAEPTGGGTRTEHGPARIRPLQQT